MNTIYIDSPDDPRLAPYQNLMRSRDTRRSGFFVAEGAHVVRRLLASDFEIGSLLLDASQMQRLGVEPPEGINTFVASPEVLRRIVGFDFHRGVLACARRKTVEDFGGWLAGLPAQTRLVICPDGQDAENLGSLFRTSVAFGVGGVLLGQHCVDPYIRRAVRVSMGAVLKIPIYESDDLLGDMQALRKQGGFHLVATSLDPAATPLAQMPNPPRLAIVFGGESDGLSEAWLAICDSQCRIEMSGSVDSLNVGVAAGVFLHHFQR